MALFIRDISPKKLSAHPDYDSMKRDYSWILSPYVVGVDLTPLEHVAFSRSDLRVIDGPEWHVSSQINASMDLKETPSRVDTWLAASTRISDDAAAWLGKNLNPELQGEEASERAWVLLYDFLSVRYGIDKEQLIAQWIQLEGTRMGPGAAEALVGFLVREGFDQVLFARNSQMVDPDLI